MYILLSYSFCEIILFSTSNLQNKKGVFLLSCQFEKKLEEFKNKQFFVQLVWLPWWDSYYNEEIESNESNNINFVMCSTRSVTCCIVSSSKTFLASWPEWQSVSLILNSDEGRSNSKWKQTSFLLLHEILKVFTMIKMLPKGMW